jgi:hypothetical protein
MHESAPNVMTYRVWARVCVRASLVACTQGQTSSTSVILR